MIDVLANSTNPKHRQSKFLGFLRQIESGALKIDEKDGESKLEVNQAKLEEFNAKEKEREAEEVTRQAEEAAFKKQTEDALRRDLDEIDDGLEQ